MSVMDIYTKYALVEYVVSLSALKAKDVFNRFKRINPTTISIVQTDNGSEFLGTFHDELERICVKHQFIYPRMPKVNGFIERFNRTIQEEFILRSDDIYYDINTFKEKLTKYLTWYNYQRPHSSLKYVSPMQFINNLIPKSGWLIHFGQIISCEWYNQYMKCPKCGKKMLLKSKGLSYNTKVKPKKKYDRSLYWCKTDDVWINLEIPSR